MQIFFEETDKEILMYVCCAKCKLKLETLEFCPRCESKKELFKNPENLFRDLSLLKYRI